MYLGRTPAPHSSTPCPLSALCTFLLSSAGISFLLSSSLLHEVHPFPVGKVASSVRVTRVYGKGQHFSRYAIHTILVCDLFLIDMHQFVNSPYFEHLFVK